MKICSSLTQKLIDEKMITIEDREIYEYGLECFLLKSIHMISYFLLALSTNKILEFFLFLLAYYPIRIYAGGFHANTRVGCYMFSCCQVFIVLNAIAIMNTFLMRREVGMVVLLLPAICFAVLILAQAPVDSENKPLSSEEKLCYRSRTYYLVCIELLLMIISLGFQMYRIYLPIMMGFLCEVVMLFLGKHKNRIQKVKIE